MTSAEHTTVMPFPIRLLTGALVLTVGVLLAMGWSAFDSYRNLVAVQFHDLRLAELRGVIVHLDEVLTMSARMAATTGDPQWERRYREFETKLDTAVKETMRLTSQSASAEAARQTNEANLELVDMENKAFALVRAGQMVEAREVLFSDAYKRQKKIYAAGMGTLIKDIKTGLAASRRSMWWRALFFGAAALLSAGLLVFIWLTVMSRLQQWRGALALEALRGAQEDLEKRVEERTCELKAEILERTRTEEGLRRSEAQLATAQIIARIGSWEWDIPANKLTWSDENYRIHGFEPHEFEVSHESANEFVHPDERLVSDAAIKSALRDEQPFSFEQRVVRRDGAELLIHQRGDVVHGPDGRVAKLVGTAQDVTEIKQAESELKRVHKQLLEASRSAGMAEVASGVLHNVGNVLNSVSVAAETVNLKLRQFKVGNLKSVAALLRENAADLPAFLNEDPRGKELPEYLVDLAENLAAPQSAIIEEMDSLRKNVEHIKEIVSMQQGYARRSSLLEPCSMIELVEDAIRINIAALARHGVQLIRKYDEVPPVVTDRHQVLQILVNLLGNAKYALAAAHDKSLVIRVSSNGAQTVKVSVIDEGIGIAPENLTRIFQHGFTTRKDGHGFGLHSGALAARELGGSLTAHSDGLGKGSAFTLELPHQMKEGSP